MIDLRRFGAGEDLQDAWVCLLRPGAPRRLLRHVKLGVYTVAQGAIRLVSWKLMSEQGISTRYWIKRLATENVTRGISD